VDENERPIASAADDRTRRGRTIVIRCWPEHLPGEVPVLRGTIRDLSRSGHIAFEGLPALTTIIGHLLGELAVENHVPRPPLS